jgi:hypothetical protein
MSVKRLLTIIIFAIAVMRAGTTGCVAVNQSDSIVVSGNLADRGITVRTTLLLDVSAPVISNARGNGKSYIGAHHIGISALGGYAVTAVVAGVVAGVAIVAGAIVVAFIVMRRRKMKSSADADARGSDDVFEDHTRLMGGVANRYNNNPCIRLRDTGGDNQVWDVSLSEDVLIGRDPGCQIHLTNPSVSRRQCKIHLSSNIAVENLSETNTTRLNGKPLFSPAAIAQGDRLRCGRVTLVVESLYASDSSCIEDINNGTVFINV